LIVTGKGERESGDICTVVAFGVGGNRMGREGDVAIGVVRLEDTADAETDVVCGSLRLLRKGLKNQDGANLDVKELREELLVSRRCSPVVDETAVDVERFDCADRTEDCDGEVLRVEKVAFGVLCKILTGRDGSSSSAAGNSVMMRRGLSSIGAILVDMMELR
jgi:hypothetical protein